MLTNTDPQASTPVYPIALLDGSIIDGYPIDVLVVDPIDNSLKLDDTGQYLILPGQQPKAPEAPAPDVAEEIDMFHKNAFFFLHRRKEILADSRLFLAPLHLRNGLAYTGTSGFKRITLGIYIEWWLNAPATRILDKDGSKHLVTEIAGSPLSGANHCSATAMDGTHKCRTIMPFKDVWRPLMEINSRYDQAKAICQAYTLAQALDVLSSLPPGPVALADDIDRLFATPC